MEVDDVVYTLSSDETPEEYRKVLEAFCYPDLTPDSWDGGGGVCGSDMKFRVVNMSMEELVDIIKQTECWKGERWDTFDEYNKWYTGEEHPVAKRKFEDYMKRHPLRDSPIVAFCDHDEFVYDGWHRLNYAYKIGKKDIDVIFPNNENLEGCDMLE